MNVSQNNESNDVIVPVTTRTIPDKKVTMKNISDKSFDRVKITSAPKKTNESPGKAGVTLSYNQMYTKKSTSPVPVKDVKSVDKQKPILTFKELTTVSAVFTTSKVRMPLLVNPSRLLLDSKTQYQNKKTAEEKGN